MYSMRDFLGFLLGAAITAACIVLLLPLSPCPCGVVPADEELFLGNGTQLADPSMKKLDMAATARKADEELFLGNGTQLADPSMKKLDMAATARKADEELFLGNGTQLADPSTKKLDMAATARKGNLAELLRSAAMEDKTIIMTFTNKAWAAPGSLLDLFLESFRIGVKTEPLLKHLVIVAVDARAFERCQHVHPFCYYLAVDGGGANFMVEKRYMTKDYLDMMWVRNKFQARILALGYSFVFTDVDIVWFRNALLRIPVGADIAMSCDKFYGDNPYDLNKRANGGFLYAKPSARTAAFFADWYEARTRYPGQNEQFVFEQVKHELSARHGVTVQFVDTTYLSGFCQPRKNFYEVCTFHGNCLVGLPKKLKKLTGVLDEWKQFKAKEALLGSNSTASTAYVVSIHFYSCMFLLVCYVYVVVLL